MKFLPAISAILAASSHGHALSEGYQDFFSKDGQNCTHVDSADPSWGYMCEGHPNFPPGTKNLGVADIHRRADPIDKASVGSSVGSNIQTGVLLALAVVSATYTYGIFHPVGIGGAQANVCFSGLAGNLAYTNGAGQHRYIYYCLTKTHTGGGCGLALTQTEIEEGMAKSHDFFAIKHKTAKFGCTNFSTAGGLNIRGKYQVVEEVNPNINACAISCEQEVPQGTVPT